MTGQLLFREAGSADDRFTRASLTFADGSLLRFADTRKFGRMQIVDVADLADAQRERRAVGKPLHVSLGIEPLSRRFTVRWLTAMLKRRARAAIKPLLLDQREIAGVGNIYDIEALWRAKIHPLRQAGSLTPAEVGRLHEAIRWVLRKGIRFGGASRRDCDEGRGSGGRMPRASTASWRAAASWAPCG